MKDIKKRAYKNIEYYEIVKIILLDSEFQKRITYHHHNEITVYDHSLNVSIKAYKIAKLLRLDYRSVAIAGLLHDFYDKPWQENKIKTTFFKQHGFVHAQEALNNTKKYFPELMNSKIENAIVRHMFPLNVIPPIYLESWIITIVDKYVSIEIFKEPKKLILSLVRIKKKRGL